MEWIKKGILFGIGGGAYYAIEILWRGRSHGTMFVLGGLCFLLMGQLNFVEPKLPFFWRMVAGAAICTMGELLFGMLFNRDYGIWDYRGQPMNWGGQICLSFSILWIFLSGAALWLYDRWDARLERILKFNYIT